MHDTTTDAAPVDLSDSRSYVAGVPHDYLAHLRRHDPVHWQEEQDGPGFWAVTKYDDCVTVNRDYERFSSQRKGTMPFELTDDEIAQQSLMMLNMDPPLHTRYRRLVNKGFTPRMVRDLEASIHRTADRIIDTVCEQGDGRLRDRHLGRAAPPGDRRAAGRAPRRPAQHVRLVQPHGRQRGPRVRDHRRGRPAGGRWSSTATPASCSPPSASTRTGDLMSALTQVEMDGERLSDMELELFFLLLTVAGNETTRNLMSGAMHAFFDFPDQWQRLVRRPLAGPAGHRGDAPLRHPGDELPAHRHLRPRAARHPDQARTTRSCSSTPRPTATRTSSTTPTDFDITRDPNPHIAFGGGGPHFCLGANLARMEIRVMFEHLLDRLPDIRQDGDVQRLQSQFINGVKHLPVAFSPSAPVGGG